MSDNNSIFLLSKAVSRAFLHDLTSWRRPAKRSEYWAVLIIVGILSFMVLVFPSITGFSKSNIVTQVYVWLWIFAWIYLFLVRLSLYVRRLRNIGHSSWWAILGFVGCFFVFILSSQLIYKLYYFLQPYIIRGIRPNEELLYRAVDTLLHSNTAVSYTHLRAHET